MRLVRPRNSTDATFTVPPNAGLRLLHEGRRAFDEILLAETGSTISAQRARLRLGFILHGFANNYLTRPSP